MLGPPPSKEGLPAATPSFAVSRSPFLLEFGSRHRRLLEELGPPGQSLPSGHPTHLSTGEVGALEVVGSGVGVPSRPWVRALGFPSVSRRVWRGRGPARDLGLGRQCLRSRGEGQPSALGLLKATGKAKRYSPSPGSRSVPTRRARQGARTDQAEWVGSRQAEEEEAERADEEAAPSSQRDSGSGFSYSVRGPPRLFLTGLGSGAGQGVWGGAGGGQVWGPPTSSQVDPWPQVPPGAGRSWVKEERCPAKKDPERRS